MFDPPFFFLYLITNCRQYSSQGCQSRASPVLLFTYTILPSSSCCYSQSGGKLAMRPYLAMYSSYYSSGNRMPRYQAQPRIYSSSGSYYSSNYSSYYYSCYYCLGCRLSLDIGLNYRSSSFLRSLAIPSSAFISNF